MTAQSDIAVVAFDLDGTILEGGSQIIPEVINALNWLATRGIRCVTATGRPLDFQLELLARYELGANTGVLQALIADERELYLLSEASSRTTAKLPLHHEATYHAHTQWNNQASVRWQTLLPIALAWLDQLDHEAIRRGWTLEREFSIQDMADRGLATIVCESSAQAADLCVWLTKELQHAAAPVMCNRNVRLIQILDRMTGKGAVLAELARYWNVPPQSILAVGDSDNDRTMLDGQFGFRCATVDNADPLIKHVVAQAGGYIAKQTMGRGFLEILHALHVGAEEFRETSGT